MSIYEELRKHYGGASSEQKLKALRTELLRPIVTVQTSAKLLEDVAPEISSYLPPDFDPQELKNTLKWLSEAGRDLQQILDALTNEYDEVPPNHV